MKKFEKNGLNIWDAFFMCSENISANARLLYLYLLTCPLSNIAGIYYISNKRISFDTDIKDASLDSCWQELEMFSKVYRILNYVIIADALFYSNPKTKKEKKEVNTIIHKLPQEVKSKIDELCIIEKWKEAQLEKEEIPLLKTLEKGTPLLPIEDEVPMNASELKNSFSHVMQNYSKDIMSKKKDLKDVPSPGINPPKDPLKELKPAPEKDPKKDIFPCKEPPPKKDAEKTEVKDAIKNNTEDALPLCPPILQAKKKDVKRESYLKNVQHLQDPRVYLDEMNAKLDAEIEALEAGIVQDANEKDEFIQYENKNGGSKDVESFQGKYNKNVPCKAQNKIDYSSFQYRNSTHEFGEFYEVDENYNYTSRLTRKEENEKKGFHFLEVIAYEVFFQFKERGFYSNYDFNTFFKKEFTKARSLLASMGVHLYKYDDAMIIFLVLKNYFRVLEMMEVGITWWQYRYDFVALCKQAWDTYAIKQFELRHFLKCEKKMNIVEKEIFKQWDKKGKFINGFNYFLAI